MVHEVNTDNPTIAKVVGDMQKKLGKGIVNVGVSYPPFPRYPTGVFPFDLSIGGGFPAGKVSILFGKEASLKTTMALLAIAYMQKSNPHLPCAFIDVEASFDENRAKAMGVNIDTLIYVLPDNAEQVVDIVADLLKTQDLGIVVVDSVAAFIKAQEDGNDADVAVVGGAGLTIGKLYRKSNLGLLRARREHRFPAVLLINQTRSKIGSRHPTQEMVGGAAFKYASALSVRLYGTNVVDKKIDKDKPSWCECKITIVKNKVDIVQTSAEFKMAIIPNSMMSVGQVYDWNYILNYLKTYELVKPALKKKDGYVFKGQKFKVYTDIRDRMYEDHEFNTLVRNSIVEAVLPNLDQDLEDEDYEEA